MVSTRALSNLMTKQPNGVDYLMVDKMVWSLRFLELAEEAWQQQDEEMKILIQAFVDGVNECNQEYSGRLTPNLKGVPWNLCRFD